MRRPPLARLAGFLCLCFAAASGVAFTALTQGAAPRGNQLQIAGFGIGEAYARTYSG